MTVTEFFNTAMHTLTAKLERKGKNKLHFPKEDINILLEDLVRSLSGILFKLPLCLLSGKYKCFS